jgi:hypothetical protein
VEIAIQAAFVIIAKAHSRNAESLERRAINLHRQFLFRSSRRKPGSSKKKCRAKPVLLF